MTIALTIAFLSSVVLGLLWPWRVTSFSPQSNIPISIKDQATAFFRFYDALLKALGFIAVLIGFALTWRLLKANVAKVRISAILDRLTKIGDSDATDARRYLYEAYCDDPRRFETIQSYQDLDPELRRISDLTVRTIGEIGILLHQGFVDEQFIAERLPLFPARTWNILNRYVEARERHNGLNSELPFKYVAYLCLTQWCRLNQANEASLIIHGLMPSLSREVPAVRLEGMRRELAKTLTQARWVYGHGAERIYARWQNIVVGRVVAKSARTGIGWPVAAATVQLATERSGPSSGCSSSPIFPTVRSTGSAIPSRSNCC